MNKRWIVAAGYRPTPVVGLSYHRVDRKPSTYFLKASMFKVRERTDIPTMLDFSPLIPSLISMAHLVLGPPCFHQSDTHFFPGEDAWAMGFRGVRKVNANTSSFWEVLWALESDYMYSIHC